MSKTRKKGTSRNSFGMRTDATSSISVIRWGMRRRVSTFRIWIRQNARLDTVFLGRRSHDRLSAAATLLLAMNKVSPRRFGVYRVNLKKGEVVLDTQAPDDLAWMEWLVSPDLVVRGFTANLPDGGGALRMRDNAQSPWRELRQWRPADYIAAMFVGEEKYRLPGRESGASDSRRRSTAQSG